MKKRKNNFGWGLFIIVVLMMFVSLKVASAGDINYAASFNGATAEADLTGYGTNYITSNWYDGNVTHGIDGSRNDYYGGGHREGGRRSYLTYTINFFETAPIINRLVIDYIVASAGGNEQRKLELWNGSGWIVVSYNDAKFPKTTYYDSDGPNSLIGLDERAIIDGPWYNISKIRIFLYSPWHDKNSEYVAIFNVQAIGPERECTSGLCCDGFFFRPNTHECRPTIGNCDIAENCTGASADCPADIKSTAECRAATGICDRTEFCDGVNNACPSDFFMPNTYECRASADVCDTAEVCTGDSVNCPADTFKPPTTECRPAIGVCDIAETCTGDITTCPPDRVRPNTYECGSAVGECDITEFCNGMSGVCPTNVFSPEGTACFVGSCDGVGTCLVLAKNLIALQLLDIANRTSPNNYTLFCDSYENTLNYLGYDVDNYWVARYFSGYVSETDTWVCGFGEPCVNNVCVLKLPEQVIFGASLDRPINEGPLEFIKTLTGVTDCNDAIGNNDGQFHQCNSFKAWYNNKAMSVIYSNKDITNMPGISFWNRFLLFLKNPFQKIFDFLLTLFEKEVQKPKDYEFINATTKFSRIYLDRKNVKAIKGITEEIEGAKRGEYVSVTYECYSEDICKSVNATYKRIGGEGSLAFCHSEPLLGKHYVASNSSVALNLWPELTARLRTSVLKIPDTSVYPSIKAPTKAIVGYPVRFEADIEGCNRPFTYSWNFGGGQTCPPLTGCGLGDSESPTHTYLTQGTKTIILTATDADGDSNSDSITINVVSLTNCQIKSKLVGCDSDQRCIMSLSGITDAHATADCENNNFDYKLCCPNIFEVDKAGCGAGLVKVSGNAVDAHTDAYGKGSFTNDVCLKSAVSGSANCWYSTGCNLANNEVCVVSLSADTDAHLSDCSDNNFVGKICCKIS